MSEYNRLQLLVNSRTESGKIDESAQQLVISYISELTRAILDQSYIISKLRQSNKIEASDIAFIMGICDILFILSIYYIYILILLIIQKKNLKLLYQNYQKNINFINQYINYKIMKMKEKELKENQELKLYLNCCMN